MSCDLYCFCLRLAPAILPDPPHSDRHFQVLFIAACSGEDWLFPGLGRRPWDGLHLSGTCPLFPGSCSCFFLGILLFFLCLTQNVFICLPEKCSWEPGSWLAGLSLPAPAHITGTEVGWSPLKTTYLPCFKAVPSVLLTQTVSKQPKS